MLTNFLHTYVQIYLNESFVLTEILLIFNKARSVNHIKLLKQIVLHKVTIVLWQKSWNDNGTNITSRWGNNGTNITGEFVMNATLVKEWRIELRPVVEQVMHSWSTRCWRAVCNHTQQVLQTAQQLIHWQSHAAGGPYAITHNRSYKQHSSWFTDSHTLPAGLMQSHTTGPTNSTAVDSLTVTCCMHKISNCITVTWPQHVNMVHSLVLITSLIFCEKGEYFSHYFYPHKCEIIMHDIKPSVQNSHI